MHSLVDARMLDTLSKKELEKYLGVTRKFHQASIVHGIHLLRLMKYDRQAMAMRRLQCESENIDPIVWTNQRFIRWVRSIDLGEFADNLRSEWVWVGGHSKRLSNPIIQLQIVAFMAAWLCLSLRSRAKPWLLL